jgi:hypothetical protein
MPMAALQLPCRPCVLSASPRLALGISQARLARGAWVADLAASWFADLFIVLLFVVCLFSLLFVLT